MVVKYVYIANNYSTSLFLGEEDMLVTSIVIDLLYFLIKKMYLSPRDAISEMICPKKSC